MVFLPTGTAYALWVGLGAALTGIVAAVMGLKLVPQGVSPT